MPLLMIVLLEAGAGFWAGVVALLGGHLTFAVVLVRGLRSAGYRPDTLGLAKLALGAAAGGALAALLPKMSPAWFELAALASAACAAFLAVAWFAKPFADTERDRLNDLLGRRLFRG
jgi:hypothetical protein